MMNSDDTCTHLARSGSRRPWRRHGRTYAVAVLGICLLDAAAAQQPAPLVDLKTTDESSEFSSTSSYDDVMAFVNTVAAGAPALVHLTTMGTTVEGRTMSLVVLGTDLADGSAASVHASNRLRVLIQAGSHGDEVDGKDAALALLRDFAAGRHSEW